MKRKVDKLQYLISLTLILLVACRPAPVEETAVDQIGQPSAIQIVVVADDFAAGEPRVPFVLYDGSSQVADAQSVTLTAFDLASDPPEAAWQGEATSYSDYEIPYWVAYPVLPAAGLWGLAATVTLNDGLVVKAQFTVQIVEQSSSPALGSRPPASKNRTLSSEPDINRLTSSQKPEPGLYQLTVAEALASDRPTVVTLATPAFCQSQICGPVVDSVAAVYAELGQQVNFIHLEIYKDFQELTVADEVAEWGLSSEPWTFVIDPQGQVVVRLGGPVSPRELLAALQPYLP